MSPQRRSITAFPVPQPTPAAVGSNREAVRRETGELVELLRGLSRAAWEELGSLDKGARAITGGVGGEPNAKAD